MSEPPANLRFDQEAEGQEARMDNSMLQEALALPEEDRRELAARIRESLVARPGGRPGRVTEVRVPARREARPRRGRDPAVALPRVRQDVHRQDGRARRALEAAARHLAGLRVKVNVLLTNSVSGSSPLPLTQPRHLGQRAVAESGLRRPQKGIPLVSRVASDSSASALS